MKKSFCILLTMFIALMANAQTVLTNPSPHNNEFGYFKDFEIRINNAIVQIAWQTIGEKNNRGFEIERRTANEPWTTVAYLATLAPDGNSTETIHYLYGDNSLLKGNVQYRLKQIDLDGRSTYSPVQTLKNLDAVGKTVVYPNPTTDGRIKVSLGSSNSLKDLQLVDLNGHLIQQWLSLSNTSQQINNLRRGNYLIRIIDRQTGMVSTEKIIAQ